MEVVITKLRARCTTFSTTETLTVKECGCCGRLFSWEELGAFSQPGDVADWLDAYLT